MIDNTTNNCKKGDILIVRHKIKLQLLHVVNTIHEGM